MDRDRDRGRIEDGPWALLLAEMGQSGRTGQITVRAHGGKTHAIAFAHGVIIGATSPMAVDSVARIAASLQLPVAGPRKRQGGFPTGNTDRELDAYLGGTQLAADQVKRLKHRILVQRAARTFAIERGTYAITARVSIPVLFGVEVDIRAVVFRGALLHLEAGRIAAELSASGVRYALVDGATADLARFELGEADKSVIAALREGTSAPEIEAKHRELDPRRIQAVFYALATCGALIKLPPREVRRERPRARGSVDLEPRQTPQGLKWMRLPTGTDAVEKLRAELDAPPADPVDACVPMLIRRDAEVSATAVGFDADRTQPMVARSANLPPPPPRRPLTEPAFDARPTRLRPNALGASELLALISTCSNAVERGVDHFTLLGVPIGASVVEVHTAYIELARNLRSDRLAELRIKDRDNRARTLLGQVCIAYSVLTDPVRRAAYLAGLEDSAATIAVALDFPQLARDAFERGLRALRADDPGLAVIELRAACELAPNDIRYIATLGHAEFCAVAVVVPGRPS